MKKHYFFISLLVYGASLHAQIAIAPNPSDHEPHQNSILDVKSSTPSKAVLFPVVSQITDAADPDNDNGYRGAIAYSKNNAVIYEHDGTNWSSIYNYVVEVKPQYFAHFSRSSNLNLSCNGGFLPPYGCTATGIIPLTNSGGSDFQGSSTNLSLASNVVTVNETGLYRVTYRSYATFNGLNTDEIQLRLQKSLIATPTVFSTIDSKSFTSDNDNLGYSPVFNGSIVIQVNAGEKFRLQGFMQSGFSPLINSSTSFQNNSTYGIGELIFEKIVL
ncbi:hypothetical protein QFZ37_002270 [Chryseobacterium ginsenosidimutans]|uniref:hypothetical protein n=1 Tax=Chryseobacterium ginsenosidimutans TaxID=687846 RepID=UPI00278088C8|nr:hypothetical protein [Chryseobacterium ginsenosidimutans]MDQ0593901.1 hypothetical protein [Chryseobacterium ginsenosidimutans]